MTEDLNTLREALEPCPWCGEPMAHVVVIEGSTFRWRKVQGCCTDGPEVRHDTLAKDQKAAEADSRARAIATWNRRAPRLEAAAVPELSYGDTMRLAVKAGLLESYDERRFGGYAAGGAELMRFASLVRSVPVGEVKPVAWYIKEHGDVLDLEWNSQKPLYEGNWKPLYTTPPAPIEGWRWVPVELTDGMLAAFADATSGAMVWDNATEDDRQSVREGFTPGYRAMLAAAPQPGDKL